MQKLPANVDSKFRYVLLAAERAERMMRGARPKIDAPNRKPSWVAMQEIRKDMVEWDYGPAEPPAEELEEELEAEGE